MRKELLAGAMALALATMMTTGAMASSQNHKGRGVRGNHTGIHGGHSRRYVKGYDGHGDSGRGPNFIGLGISGVGVGVDDGYGCSPTDKTYIGGFCGDYVPN